MNNRLIVFLFIPFFIFYGCSKKVEFKYPESNKILLEKIQLENRFVCNLKAKTAIDYEDRLYKVRFKSYFKKSCNGNIDVLILGVLNSVVAEIQVRNGVITVAKSKKEDISSDLNAFFENMDINELIKLLNIPYSIPKDIKEKYKLKDGLIIHDSQNIEYTINSDYKIVMVKKDETIIKYEYDKMNLKKIDFIDNDKHLTIKFL